MGRPKRTKIDIHHSDAELRKELEAIRTHPALSPKNKELILTFDEETRFKQGIGVPRRIKVANTLKLTALRHLQKDFDQLTKYDLERALAKIENFPNANTRHDYKVILKKFLRWVEWGDKSFRDRKRCPEWLQIIRTTMTTKEKAQSKLTKSDLLTTEEVYKLIKAAQHPRDKAFLSLLYELGARISEVGNLRLADVTKEEHGFHIDLEGKTGRRTPVAIISAPHLTTWLNTHPFTGDPNAPLWVQLNNHSYNLPNRQPERLRQQDGYVYKPMTYEGLSRLLSRIAAKARIKKDIYPHLFRHTRVTHLLAEGILTESQAKRYFGWAPSSRILGEVYSHLTDQDANDAILAGLGLKTKLNETDKLKPSLCAQCRTANPADFRFCGKCGHALNTTAAIEYEEQKKDLDAELYTSVENLLADPDGRKLFLKHLSKDLVKMLATQN